MCSCLDWAEVSGYKGRSGRSTAGRKAQHVELWNSTSPHTSALNWKLSASAFFFNFSTNFIVAPPTKYACYFLFKIHKYIQMWNTCVVSVNPLKERKASILLNNLVRVHFIWETKTHLKHLKQKARAEEETEREREREIRWWSTAYGWLNLVRCPPLRPRAKVRKEGESWLQGRAGYGGLVCVQQGNSHRRCEFGRYPPKNYPCLCFVFWPNF